MADIGITFGTTVGVRFRLLGDIGLETDGVVQALSGRRQRELLALLLLEQGTDLAADRISHELWGESLPKTARNSVQRFIADLRNHLGPYAERLVTGSTGYRLDFDRAECDLFWREDLIAQARNFMSTGNLDQAADLLGSVAAMGSAPPFGGAGDIDVLERQRRVVDQQLRVATEERFAVELALGRHGELLAEMVQFVTENPYRERAWAHYLVALYRSGLPQDALAAFDQAAAGLQDDLGVKPSNELTAVRQQILDHAPELQAPPLVPKPSDLRTPDVPARRRALPAYLERSQEIPLVGRTVELETLAAAMSETLRGNPQIVGISGEPGIGKTRLGAAVANLAAAQGFTITYGLAREGLTSPYTAWSEALSHLAGVLSSTNLRRHRNRFGTTLRPLVPTIDYLMPQGPDARAPETISVPHESSPRTDEQMELFQAALGLIDQAAEAGPVLIVLDDLQWADASTLQLLTHLAQRATGAVLLVLMYRNTSLEADSKLVELMARLAPMPSVRDIVLGGLGVEDLTKVVQNLGGTTSDESLAGTVRDHTNGNPFFATEVLRQWIERRAADPAPMEQHVPRAAQQVVQHRVSQLGADAAAILRAASVFGRDFELDLLAEALGQDDFSVLESLERGLSDGVLLDSSQGPDRFQFAHDLLREALYEELSQSRRARLHIRIADAIEQLRPAERGARSDQIARQLLAAGDPRLARRTCLAAQMAGTLAADSLAPIEAAEWFETALNQLDLAGDDTMLRGELLVQLGTQQLYASDPTARATLLTAGRLAAESNNTSLLVAACLANTRGTFAHVWDIDREAVALLTEALLVPDKSDTATHASLLAALASEEWDLDHRVIVERHEEAIELAQASGDPGVLADATLRFARARGCYLSLDEHNATNDQIQQLIADHNLAAPMTLLNMHMSKHHAALQAADHQAFDEVVRASDSLREQLPLPFLEAHQDLLEVSLAGLAGDTARYETLAGELLESNLERGDPEAFYIYEGHVLYARWMQGRTDEILGEIDRIATERPDAELYQSVSALMHREANMPELAAEKLRQAHERGFVEGKNVFVVQSIGFWAEVAAAVGNCEAAEVLREILLPFRSQFLGNLTQLSQPVDLTLGRLAITLGRFDEAHDLLESSQTTATQFEAPWMLAQTALAQATLAKATGATQAATAYLETAIELAQAGNYRKILSDATALSEQLTDPET